MLVVIAIIGILASVVLVSLNNARSKSRDANRVATLHELRNALELYASNNNGLYPFTGSDGLGPPRSNSLWWGACPSFGAHALSGPSGYIPYLAPTYISVLPTDPSATCASFKDGYLYTSDGIDYMILDYGMVENQTSNRQKRPGFPNELDFAVYTAGATLW